MTSWQTFRTTSLQRLTVALVLTVASVGVSAQIISDSTATANRANQVNPFTNTDPLRVARSGVAGTTGFCDGKGGESCDDGLYCNGVEVCIDGACTSGMSPCFELAGCDSASACDEDTDTCAADCNENGMADGCDISDGTSEDCNENNIPDDCDISDETSNDIDDNGTPDECQPDCNENGTPDSYEISMGTSEDCNDNGVPDKCDTSDETSKDCNDNLIPDECEDSGDCNHNGILDSCDITSGTENDCNNNGIPDSCDINGDTLYGSQGDHHCEDAAIYDINPVTGEAEVFIDFSDFDKGDSKGDGACELTGLTLSADGGTLYVSVNIGHGSGVLLVDTQTKEIDERLLYDPDDDCSVAGECESIELSDLALLDDGTLVGSDTHNNVLRTIDLDTGEAPIRCSTDNISLSGLALSPNGVLYGSTDQGETISGYSGPSGTVFIVDPNTCSLQQIGEGTGFNMVPGLAFGPDGRLFGATGYGSDGDVAGIAPPESPELIEIDTNTGLGTLVNRITGKNVSNIEGLVFGMGTSLDENGDGIPDECATRGGGDDDNLGGNGTTTANGTFSSDASDDSDRVLAGINVLQAEPRKQVSWRVTRVEGTLGNPGPGAGTSDGFDNGIGFVRTFETKVTSPAQTYTAVVFINLNAVELAAAGLGQEDVRLHALVAGQWETAGTNDLGNSAPTTNVGDYGYFFSNSEQRFWAVRDDATITFAVGTPIVPEQPQPEQPVPADDDGDGVDNDIDLCPNTEAGATVDADGCAIVDDEPAQETPEPGTGQGVCGAGLPLCGATGLAMMLGMMFGLVGLRTSRRSLRRRSTK